MPAKKFITLKVFRFFRYDRNEPIVPLCALNLPIILIKRIKKKMLKNIHNFFRKEQKGEKKYCGNDASMDQPGPNLAVEIMESVAEIPLKMPP